MVFCPWFGLWNKGRGAGKKKTQKKEKSKGENIQLTYPPSTQIMNPL